MVSELQLMAFRHTMVIDIDTVHTLEVCQNAPSRNLTDHCHISSDILISLIAVFIFNDVVIIASDRHFRCIAQVIFPVAGERSIFEADDDRNALSVHIQRIVCAVDQQQIVSFAV